MRAHVVAVLNDLLQIETKEMRARLQGIMDLFAETVHPITLQHGRSMDARADYYKSCHYTAHPPIREERDSITGRIRSLWFSCAGFVITCYESSPVKKLMTDYTDPSFPTVDKDVVRETWFLGLTPTQNLMDAIGIGNGESWPILMPGYVANAFKRDDNSIRNVPYSPRSADIRVL